MGENLFDFIENLFVKREPVNSQTVFKEQYMTIKFLSLYPGTFFIAEEANRLMTGIPGWGVNCFLFANIQKGKPPRFEYPKKQQQKTLDKKVISKLCEHFCCGEQNAIEIASILEREDPSALEGLSGNPKMKRGKNAKK